MAHRIIFWLCLPSGVNNRERLAIQKTHNDGLYRGSSSRSFVHEVELVLLRLIAATLLCTESAKSSLDATDFASCSIRSFAFASLKVFVSEGWYLLQIAEA